MGERYGYIRVSEKNQNLQRQWKHITQTLRADIKVLDMPLLDTRSTNGNDLERTFIADLVLQILSYCAQKERENILIRQRQGIDAMKIVDGKKISSKTGRPTGRPEITYPQNWDEVYHKWKNGEITAVASRELLGLKTNTFYKLVHQYII